MLGSYRLPREKYQVTPTFGDGWYRKLYQGMNWESSDPEANDIPMCHPAFFLNVEFKF